MRLTGALWLFALAVCACSNQSAHQSAMISDTEARKIFDRRIDEIFHGNLRDVEFRRPDELWSVVGNTPGVSAVPIQFRLQCLKPADVAPFNATYWAHLDQTPAGFQLESGRAPTGKVLCATGQEIRFHGLIYYLSTSDGWTMKAFAPDVMTRGPKKSIHQG